jgi:excisionase family DNA binding protein
MLIVETAGIRRDHLVKGKSIKEIARDLNISRNTVRKVLRSGESSSRMSGKFSHIPSSAVGRLRSIGC